VHKTHLMTAYANHAGCPLNKKGWVTHIKRNPTFFLT
jgi:hypothetical protein